MNRVYLIIRYKNPRKTIRRVLSDVHCALVTINDIPTADYAEITEIKIEID